MKPKLRFPGFQEEWEEKKLGEVAESYVGGGTPNTKEHEFWENGNIAWIQSSDIDKEMVTKVSVKKMITEYALKNSSAKLISKNSIAVVTRVGVGKVALMNENYATSQDFLSFVDIKGNEKFWLYQIKRLMDRQSLYLQGTSIKGITKDELLKVKTFSPSLPEQEKIGEFLSKVDERIEKQEEKVELLKERKKGWMQQLFSQSIRFKDENGQDYPAWEEKKLGDIGYTFTGLSGKTKEDFGHGDAKFVTFVNILNNTIAKCDGVDNVEIDRKQHEVKYGDFMFTTSSETPAEVGMSSLWLGTEANVYLNSFCFGYRLKNDINISYRYLAYLLRSKNVRKQFIKLAQGISRYNISKTKVMDILIAIPSLPEQEKIAEFLSKQDELIEKEEEKLSLLKEQKKGLLQQMFV